jgi:hypothetical protein
MIVDHNFALEQVECVACGADAFKLTEIGRGFEP